ncbi:MAG TPA: thermonuclease family protein [Atribacteraceae bacterium]|nr:thermonuclease family protein [Atribacteraceae bacterium]
MKKLFLVTLLFLFLSVTMISGGAGAQEGPMTARILRVPRPNIVLAEVSYGGETLQKRIRLAGVNPPLGLPGVYGQGQLELRRLVADREVYFDFALGFGPEDSLWTGYLYIPDQDEGDGEWIVVNAELIRQGLAEVDEKTAGENQLVYLWSLEQKARESLLGLWKDRDIIARARSSRTDDICPECLRN